MKPYRVFPITIIIVVVLFIILPLFALLIQTQQFILIGLMIGILSIAGGVAGIALTGRRNNKHNVSIADVRPKPIETPSHTSETKTNPLAGVRVAAPSSSLPSSPLPVSSPQDKSQKGTRFTKRSYGTVFFAVLLLFAILWLYVEIGKIDITGLNLDINTLSSHVLGNSNDIRTLSFLVSNVQKLAENADRHAHTHYSDSRLKKDVSSLENVLPSVTQLRGVMFYWDEEKIPGELIMSNSPQIGFLAQELELVYPELVLVDANGYRYVDYALLTPVLVEAIKEQQIQILFLQQQNLELERRIEQLEAITNTQQ